MFTTKATGQSVFHVLTNLVNVHPVGLFAERRSRAASEFPADRLAKMPPHLRDDIGLPPVPAPEPDHSAIVRARNRASRWGS